MCLASAAQAPQAGDIFLVRNDGSLVKGTDYRRINGVVYVQLGKLIDVLDFSPELKGSSILLRKKPSTDARLRAAAALEPRLLALPDGVINWAKEVQAWAPKAKAIFELSHYERWKTAQGGSADLLEARKSLFQSTLGVCDMLDVVARKLGDGRGNAEDMFTAHEYLYSIMEGLSNLQDQTGFETGMTEAMILDAFDHGLKGTNLRRTSRDLLHAMLHVQE